MRCRGLLRYQSLSTVIFQVRVLEPSPCPQPADVSFFPGSFLPPAHMWMCSCVCVCVHACARLVTAQLWPPLGLAALKSCRTAVAELRI